MTSEMRFKVRVAVVVLLTGTLTAYAVAEGQSEGLAPPERFDSIADTAARSAALFTELGKVLTHPRCTNCHPAGRARRRRSWPPGYALQQLPPAGQLRPWPRAGKPGVAPGTT
jgi:hypothetical protein